MSRGILTINAGSSSIKFALFRLDHPISPKAEVSGQIDGIGTDATKMVAKNQAGERIADQMLSGEKVSHAQAFDALLKWFTASHADWEIVAVGHRVVHGGDLYSQPTIIDSQVLEHLNSFVPLAPLHQPHNVAGIRALQALLPKVPQVACFDTAFHRSQPAVAQMFGLPRWVTAEGVKRYGFHGLSYKYIAGAFAAGRKASKTAAKKVPFLGGALTAAEVAKNPWHTAVVRADKTGVLLAGILARTEIDRCILVGHSLGGRAMITAAESLGTDPDAPRIQTLHTLGAAEGKKGDWRPLNDAVEDAVHNYFSRNDKVLELAYRTAQAGGKAAAVVVDVSKGQDVTALVRRIDAEKAAPTFW